MVQSVLLQICDNWFWLSITLSWLLQLCVRWSTCATMRDNLSSRLPVPKIAIYTLFVYLRLLCFLWRPCKGVYTKQIRQNIMKSEPTKYTPLKGVHTLNSGDLKKSLTPSKTIGIIYSPRTTTTPSLKFPATLLLEIPCEQGFQVLSSIDLTQPLTYINQNAQTHEECFS